MSGPESTSLSLLDGLRNHNQLAWGEFVQLYYPLIYGWCRQAGLSSEDAADTVQEVFRAVANGIMGFRRDRPGDHFRAWLHGIADHKIKDVFRKQRSFEVAVGGTTALTRLQEIPDVDPSLMDDKWEIGALARRALDLVRDEFEPKTWEAASMILLAGMSPRAVAKELSISRNAVYKAKARVVRRVREKIDDELE